MLQRRVSPAKKYLRRTLQIIALVGTLLVGIIALALIASQTPWFRDWLRRLRRPPGGQLRQRHGVDRQPRRQPVLRGRARRPRHRRQRRARRHAEAGRGQVQPGAARVARPDRAADRACTSPTSCCATTRSGWNLASLIKKQQQEADRQGPGKPLSLPDIEIDDGRVAIDDRAPSPSYTLPSKIDGLNAKAGFAYAPVHYSVTLDRFAFNGHAPDLQVQQPRRPARHQRRRSARREAVSADGAELHDVDGVVRHYLANPALQVTVSSPKLSLPEFGGRAAAAPGL